MKRTIVCVMWPKALSNPVTWSLVHCFYPIKPLRINPWPYLKHQREWQSLRISETVKICARLALFSACVRRMIQILKKGGELLKRLQCQLCGGTVEVQMSPFKWPIILLVRVPSATAVSKVLLWVDDGGNPLASSEIKRSVHLNCAKDIFSAGYH